MGTPDAVRLAELAAAFAAHGDLVHDLVGWRLRAAEPVPHANEVADIVRDTFMIAFAAPVDPMPQPVRAWLLALSRNECLRALAVPGRAPWPVAAPPGDLGERRPRTDPVRGTATGKDAGLPAKDLRMLVRWAAEGLDRREREILELGLRHGLPADEIGHVMEIAPEVAGRALDEVGRRFVRVLGTLLLARSAAGSCVRLVDLTLRWNGLPGADWRRRFLRHADACETCTHERTHRVDAAAVLRLPRLVRAPATVERWVLGDATDGTLAAERAALAERAGPFDADGFPRALDGEISLRRSRLSRSRRPESLRSTVPGR